MQTILVTGGTGYIGSHTCLELLKKGYKVIIIDSLVNSSEKVIGNINLLLNHRNINDRFSFIKGDISDENLLDQIFKEAKESSSPITSVMHFAGLKSVSESISNPLKYWDKNVGGSINLFKFMEKYECRTIIFSSSATVYEIKGKSLLSEGSPIKASNPYGQSKVAIERLLNDIFLNCQNNWRIANLRYFNPIGAHNSGLLGENPIGIPSNIFPIINKVAANQMPKLQVYGKDWPTHDGTGIRDYIHVMDLADGHIAAMEHLLKNKSQIINLNLGTGKSTSVLELINIFERVNKVKVEYEFVARRKGDHGIVIADNSLAKSLLNWEPKRNIYEMCKDGWNWQINNIEAYE
tara:strand:- start:318 stop:1367 length:1050 start_codon:yes stop_codon:yes gene_type:complete